MVSDPRSLKLYKSCWFEVKSMQHGSQIYVSIDCFLLPIIVGIKKEKTHSVISLRFNKCCPAELDQNACREGSFTPCAQVNVADDRRQIL